MNNPATHIDSCYECNAAFVPTPEAAECPSCTFVHFVARCSECNGVDYEDDITFGEHVC